MPSSAWFLLLLFPFAWSYLPCPNTQTYNLLNGTTFPAPAVTDPSYRPGFSCSWKILPKAGYFIKLDLGFGVRPNDNDFLQFTDESGLDYVYDYNTYTSSVVTPVELHISFKALGSVGGNLTFYWSYVPIPYDSHKTVRIESGDRGALLLSEDIYRTAVTVVSSSSIALFATSQPYLNGYNFNYMMYTFIFDGTGINGKYLGSLYRFQQKPYFYWGNNGDANQTTVTVVSGYYGNYGIALIKPYVDIQDYQVSLKYATSDVAQTFTASQSCCNKGVATILYYPYDPYGSNIHYYLTSALFSNYENNDQSYLEWHAGDLFTDNSTLATWRKADNIAANPPVIPGLLNTFLVKNGSCTFTIASGALQITGEVPSNAVGVYSTGNYPFTDLPQLNTVRYTIDKSSTIAVTVTRGAPPGTAVLLRYRSASGLFVYNSIGYCQTSNVYSDQFDLSFNNGGLNNTGGALATFTITSSGKGLSCLCAIIFAIVL